MSGTVFVEGVHLETWSCGECGIFMAIAHAAIEGRRKSGKGFYCFNGHCHAYKTTTEDILKRDLERERQKREAAEQRAATTERNLAEVTKAHQKMRARVANGVCPCCNRSFTNLRDHMAGEHPDFGTERTLLALRQAFGMTQAAVAQEAGVRPSQVSSYERGKYLTKWATRAITAWVEKSKA